jgi:hypothetical protein
LGLGRRRRATGEATEHVEEGVRGDVVAAKLGGLGVGAVQDKASQAGGFAGAQTEEAKSAAADTTQQAGDKVSETAKEKASGVTGAAQAKARQVEERGQSLVDELRILLVHSLLHVLDYDQEVGAELLEVEVVKVVKAKTPSAEADKAGAVADDVDVFVGWDAEMVGADTRVPDEEAVGDLVAVRED